MEATDELINKLRDIIETEQQVVTYKWLSKRLESDIESSKKLLADFIEKESCSEITASYCVIGYTQDGQLPKSRKVYVVNANDVEKVKSSLHGVSSVHIYSIQKTELKNSNCLIQTDFEVKDAVRRFYFQIPQESSTSANIGQALADKTNDDSSPEKEEKPVVKKHEPAKVAISNGKSRDKNPMKAFLSRSSRVEAKKEVEVKTKKDVEMRKDPITVPVVKSEPKQKIQNVENEIKASNDSFSRKKSKKEVKKPAPKRTLSMRNKFLSSSSEDDSSSNEDVEEGRMPENNAASNNLTKPDTPPKSTSLNTFREKRLVSQTFVDSDGYLVTKKVCEVVEEPVQEQMEVEPSIPAAPRKAPIKTEPIVKNKQRTLTSYFK